MRNARWPGLLLAVLPFLAGCSGFWSAPANNGGNTNTALSSGNFYVLSKGSSTSQIYGFNITKGALTALSGSPYAVNGVAYGIAPDPTGSFLYVSSTAGVYLYAINSTSGALTVGAQVSQDLVATSIAVDPGGNWLIEGLATGVLAAIPITSSGGFDNGATRTTQQMVMAGTQVEQVAIAPNHTFIVVALGSTGTQVFPFTSSSNSSPIGTALAPTLSTVNKTGAGAALSAAVDPQSRFVYIGETAVFLSSTTSSGGLRAFAVTASPLSVSELASSPYVSGGTSPRAIQPKATGDYVYVSSWQGSSAGLMTPFEIAASGTTYKLTALTSTITTGDEPSGLAEDNLGNFMLAANGGGSPTFNGYIFDTTTLGKLDQTNTDSTVSDPIAIVAVP